MQGTYGNGKTNGETEFQGCAVACLATPHRKDELRNYIIRHGVDYDGSGTFVVQFGGSGQRRRVAEQFGITERLMILAEGFFEGQTYHGAAINFVKDFACSLQEGADITPRMVNAWAEENLGTEIVDYEDVRGALFEQLNLDEEGDEVMESPEYLKAIEQKTKLFLNWLKSLTKSSTPTPYAQT